MPDNRNLNTIRQGAVICRIGGKRNPLNVFYSVTVYCRKRGRAYPNPWEYRSFEVVALDEMDAAAKWEQTHSDEWEKWSSFTVCPTKENQ